MQATRIGAALAFVVVLAHGADITQLPV